MNTRTEKINNNMGLVYACVKRFVGKGIEYDDLVQAGSLGLIKAVDGFDETRGFRLSTYAVPVILGEIKKLFRESGTVTVGRTLKDLSLKVSRACEQFKRDNERSPRVSELAEILGVEQTLIAEALASSCAPISLTVNSDEGDDQFDIRVESQDEKITEVISLNQVIHELLPKDRALIILRFFKNQTQANTAKILGMTQVQVSRKEKKILECLRLKLNK